MAALSADRNTPHMGGDMIVLPVKGATKIYAGAMVVVDAAGYAKGAVTGLGLIGVGRAEKQIDNSLGADGALNIKVRRGIFRFDNSTSGDLIAQANIGARVFAVDDHTVALTDGSGTRSRVGSVADVDSTGVDVEFDPDDLIPFSALGKVFVPIRVATLVGTGVYYAQSPVAGRITTIRTIIEGVLTTGNATVTAAINGVGVTTGVVTITQAASAAGDVHNVVPTALNVVAAGDKLSLTVGGSNATATVANFLLEITI